MTNVVQMPSEDVIAGAANALILAGYNPGTSWDVAKIVLVSAAKDQVSPTASGEGWRLATAAKAIRDAFDAIINAGGPEKLSRKALRP